MTKTATLLALACALIAISAAVSVLGRDIVPLVGSQLQATTGGRAGPAANREGKQDKLPVLALASLSDQAELPQLSEPLRQAFASDAPVATTASPPRAAAVAIPQQQPSLQQPPKPTLATKPSPPPAPQKTYALLSDAQIAAIKGRLKLSASQEAYWPSVEGALRAVARKIHATRQGNPAAGAPPIDPDSDEVQQLKSAAMPLLFQLREDQKQEVRSLARIIGLHAVAAQI